MSVDTQQIEEDWEIDVEKVLKLNFNRFDLKEFLAGFSKDVNETGYGIEDLSEISQLTRGRIENFFRALGLKFDKERTKIDKTAKKALALVDAVGKMVEILQEKFRLHNPQCEKLSEERVLKVLSVVAAFDPKNKPSVFADEDMVDAFCRAFWLCEEEPVCFELILEILTFHGGAHVLNRVAEELKNPEESSGHEGDEFNNEVKFFKDYIRNQRYEEFELRIIYRKTPLSDEDSFNCLPPEYQKMTFLVVDEISDDAKLMEHFFRASNSPITSIPFSTPRMERAFQLVLRHRESGQFLYDGLSVIFPLFFHDVFNNHETVSFVEEITANYPERFSIIKEYLALGMEKAYLVVEGLIKLKSIRRVFEHNTDVFEALLEIATHDSSAESLFEAMKQYYFTGAEEIVRFYEAFRDNDESVLNWFNEKRIYNPTGGLSLADATGAEGGLSKVDADLEGAVSVDED